MGFKGQENDQIWTLEISWWLQWGEETERTQWQRLGHQRGDRGSHLGKMRVVCVRDQAIGRRGKERSVAITDIEEMEHSN